MSLESIVATLGNASAGTATGRLIELGPSGGVSAGDGTRTDAAQAGRFSAALDQASSASGSWRAGLPSPLGNMLRALDGIDVQARSVTDFAQSAQASDGDLTPGEIVQLTMKCQEFMFQCQLTSNIANRSADGVQQLFRQQG